jgi:hypothetical protein
VGKMSDKPWREDEERFPMPTDAYAILMNLIGQERITFQEASVINNALIHYIDLRNVAFLDE